MTKHPTYIFEWRLIAGEPEKLKSPGWHNKVLASRLAKVEAGKGEFLTVAQFMKRCL